MNFYLILAWAFVILAVVTKDPLASHDTWTAVLAMAIMSQLQRISDKLDNK